jgi:hypothetical protein
MLTVTLTGPRIKTAKVTLWTVPPYSTVDRPVYAQYLSPDPNVGNAHVGNFRIIRQTTHERIWAAKPYKSGQREEDRERKDVSYTATTAEFFDPGSTLPFMHLDFFLIHENSDGASLTGDGYLEGEPSIVPGNLNIMWRVN